MINSSQITISKKFEEIESFLMKSAYPLRYRNYCTLIAFCQVLSLRYEYQDIISGIHFINDKLLKRPKDSGLTEAYFNRTIKSVGFKLTPVWESFLDPHKINECYLLYIPEHVTTLLTDYTCLSPAQSTYLITDVLDKKIPLNFKLLNYSNEWKSSNRTLLIQ